MLIIKKPIHTWFIVCHNVSHCVPRGMSAYHWDPALLRWKPHRCVCVFVLRRLRRSKAYCSVTPPPLLLSRTITVNQMPQ